MLLVFDTLDYNSLNHPIFIDQLLSTFRSLGLAEKHASSLQIKLSPGSVVAEILGPPAVRKHLEAVPLQYVEVMGCYARKLPRAPPRLKQSRPVSSLSDATVLSSDSSRHLETQANQLLNMWLETPKSDALTTRSDMDTIANQMVSHFVVCSSDADSRCQVILSACTLFKTSASLLGFAMICLPTFCQVPFLNSNQPFSNFVQFSQVFSPKASAAIEATGPQESARQAILAAKAKAKQHEELVEAVEMPIDVSSLLQCQPLDGFPWQNFGSLAGYCRK